MPETFAWLIEGDHGAGTVYVCEHPDYSTPNYDGFAKDANEASRFATEEAAQAVLDSKKGYPGWDGFRAVEHGWFAPRGEPEAWEPISKDAAERLGRCPVCGKPMEPGDERLIMDKESGDVYHEECRVASSV